MGLVCLTAHLARRRPALVPAPAVLYGAPVHPVAVVGANLVLVLHLQLQPAVRVAPGRLTKPLALAGLIFGATMPAK